LPISNSTTLVADCQTQANRQLEIENLREWLADPGCSPQIRESNADLETMACSSPKA
jgi:hypothetical protein